MIQNSSAVSGDLLDMARAGVERSPLGSIIVLSETINLVSVVVGSAVQEGQINANLGIKD